jgi:hypothetical protein
MATTAGATSNSAARIAAARRSTLRVAPLIARQASLVLAAVLFSANLSAAAPETTPESVVNGIYAEAAKHLEDGTPLAALHLTDDFSTLIDRAEKAAAKRDDIFIDGDLALDCQDCGSLSKVAVTRSTGPAAAAPKAGHVWVEARFTIYDEERRVLYDLVETSKGWRVDDIVSGDFDVRAEAQSYLANPPKAPR